MPGIVKGEGCFLIEVISIVTWRRQFKFYLLRFLRLKDMPGKVALGFAVGSCVNFWPTFGFGVPIALFLAGLVRSTLVAGLIGDLMFKPLFPVMFYLDIWVGGKLVGQDTSHLVHAFGGLLRMKGWAYILVGRAFFVGAVVNSLILGTILFVVVYRIFTGYRYQLIQMVWKQKFF